LQPITEVLHQLLLVGALRHSHSVAMYVEPHGRFPELPVRMLPLGSLLWDGLIPL